MIVHFKYYIAVHFNFKYYIAAIDSAKRKKKKKH